MVILAYFKGVPREHPFYFSCFCVFSQETSENLSVFAFFKGVPREHPSFCICLELFFLPLAGSIGGSVEPPDVIQYKQNLSLAVFSPAAPGRSDKSLFVPATFRRWKKYDCA